MVKVDGNFPNTGLATTSKNNMQYSVVFVSIPISVVVDMATVDCNVVEIERSFLGESAQDRFSNSIIVGRGTLDVNISITVIHCNFEVRKVRINTQVMYLLFLIQCKASGFSGYSMGAGAGFRDSIIKNKFSTS